MQQEERKYPIGGYAPGNYTCNCVTCKQEFMGDKYARQCEPCAIKMFAQQETLEEAAERLAEEYRDVRINPSTKFQIQQLIIKGAKWQAERMYSEDEVRKLLEIQRGNCYVAVLTETRNVDTASLASSAPEPMGKDGWVKNKK